MSDVLLFSNYYVQLVRFDKKRKKVLKTLNLAVAEGIISRGEIKKEAELMEVIKQLVSQEKGLEKIVMVIPESNVSSKSLTLPANIDKEIEEAVDFEAEQFLPYPLNLMVLDFKQVPNGKEKHVLFFAVRKEVIDAYVKMLEKLGIEVLSVETPALSLARLVEKDKQTGLLIYVDKFEAVLTIAKSDEVVATSVINQSDNFVEVLGNTVLRMLNFYSKFKVEKILIGGAGVTKEMVNKISEFKIPVGGFEPIYQIDQATFNNFLLPISAAISDVELPENRKTINLLPDWYVDKYRKIRQQSFWSRLLSFWFFYILLIFVFTGGGFYWLSYQKENIAKVQNQVPQTRKEILDQVNMANKYAKLAVSLSKTDFFPIKTFRAISGAAGKEIKVMKVEFSGQDYNMVLSGIADNRESLLGYKKKLEELTDMIESVALPVSSFNVEQDIPFQFYLKIKKDIYEVEKS